MSNKYINKFIHIILLHCWSFKLSWREENSLYQLINFPYTFFHINSQNFSGWERNQMKKNSQHHEYHVTCDRKWIVVFPSNQCNCHSFTLILVEEDNFKFQREYSRNIPPLIFRDDPLNALLSKARGSEFSCIEDKILDALSQKSYHLVDSVTWTCDELPQNTHTDTKKILEQLWKRRKKDYRMKT